MHIAAFNPYHHYPHFTDKEVDVRRGEIAPPRSRRTVAELSPFHLILLDTTEPPMSVGGAG